MSGDLYLGAYWGPRQESAEQCAERLGRCLKELAAVSGMFASWYKRGRSSRDSLKHPVQPDEIVTLLESGRNRRDSDKSVIEELGFHVGVWNGASEERSASLSVSCGAYSQSQGFGNSVVVSFPEELSELAEKEPALKALLAVVSAWEPDWAGIFSRTSRTMRSFSPGRPFVDWMIYLKGKDIDPRKLPSSASLVKLEDQGSIIITQDVPVDANDQSHVQNVRAVEAAIPV